MRPGIPHRDQAQGGAVVGPCSGREVSFGSCEPGLGAERSSARSNRLAPFRTLIEGLSFGECPRWHEGRLYLSDFYAHRVLAVSTDGGIETIARVPQQPAGLGWLPDGRLLVVSMRDRRILRCEDDGSLQQHADLSGLVSSHLNDMVVACDGRAWVGNFGFDLMAGERYRTTALVCVEPNGEARIAADGLGFPNGMAITPDGTTVIVAETIMNRLSAFRVAHGTLSQRRTWAAFGDVPDPDSGPIRVPRGATLPDGICLDAEGAVWVADAGNRRLLRVAEGGAILEQRATEGVGVFACALGGDDGRTLFACVAPSFLEREVAHRRDAAVVMTTVDVPGPAW
ncbi:MAG: SMP-30/gluconolactonase/LRE family protein [Burkholderiales bacterium]|nr:MAG: SMP-30/gluconolactonase/LRE family protein [Burkholderiales bacterium]